MNFKKLIALFGVSSVWLTTHFGGGFASGRQIIDFYASHGWYALFLPILAMALQAWVLYYAWSYAAAKKKFEYGSWSKGFYKPVDKVAAPLFEVAYVILLLVASSVAFATGGATVRDMIGTPYVLNTIVIAIAIFFLTIRGAKTIRNASSIIAIIIMTGLVIIYGSNVIMDFQDITSVAAERTTDTGFMQALWSTLLYLGFQILCVGSYISVAQPIKSKADAKKVAIMAFLANGLVIMLTSWGIMAHYPSILEYEVPTLFVASQGIGGEFSQWAVSILILLGVFTTGVNLVYGGSIRIVAFFVDDTEEAKRSKMIMSTALYVVITWIIALAGLIPLIAVGYGYLGYVGLFLVAIPAIIIGLKNSKKWAFDSENSSINYDESDVK